MKIFFAIALALTILSVALPVAFAQEETPPEVPYQVIHGIWAAAVAAPIALAVAFATCMVGYLSKTAPEHFKITNFVYTALISLAIGFLTIYAGWSYTQIELWLANGFLTWYIWKVATIVARIIAKKQIATTATGPPAA
jgi:predicted neutral ceramidase superfamily lipid hydrolase